MGLAGFAASLPSFRNLLVSLGKQVYPGRGALQLHINRRANVVEMIAPNFGQWQGFFPFKCFRPHALHLGAYFAISVLSNSSTRSITQSLGACHRARHSCGMQDALPTHATVPNGFFDRMLNEGEKFWTHRDDYAETRLRRFLINSLASLTAVEASAA